MSWHRDREDSATHDVAQRVMRSAPGPAEAGTIDRQSATGVVARQHGEAPTPQRDNPGSADDGGPADVTNLEQDMRQILQDWRDAAVEGVAQFVTNQLSARLDSLESGDWVNFISSLIGNTIWAASAFSPVGVGLRAGVAAFRISMVGIGVAAVPAVPNKSESALPQVRQLCVDYIWDTFEQLNGPLRTKATALLKQSPGQRYPALREFVKASFREGLYTLPPGAVPQLNGSAIRDAYLRFATDWLAVMTPREDAKTFLDPGDPLRGTFDYPAA